MIFFLSIHIMWEFTRYGLQEKTELLILSFYFTSIGNGKVLRLYSDSHAVLPQLAWAVNSHFPVFNRSERRKTGICSFTSALIRGKLDFQLSSAPRGGKQEFAALPPFSSAVMSILEFSSAPRGGKLEIADMQRVHMADIFQSDFLTFFPFFCLPVGHGSGLSSTK